MARRGDYVPIPEPVMNVESHQEVLSAIKLTVDTLVGNSSPKVFSSSAVTWEDLVAVGVITRDQIPKR